MHSKSEIRVDQSLHGYDRGHRQLASSIELDNQSRAEMLVLSDLLVSAAVDQGRSYLTAYPLKAASRYVLARTWAAGNDFRPGSVWTHSLVLDYQALVLMPDLMHLNSLFRQPQPHQDLKDYSLPIAIDMQEGINEGFSASIQQVTIALAKLYGPQCQDDVIVPSGPNQDNQILALALWRQMWPALRRQFAFTTAEGASLPGFGFSCTLCFSEVDTRNTTSPDLVHTHGFHALLDDLPMSGPTKLRNFLNRHVIQSSHPRTTAIELAGYFFQFSKIDSIQQLDLAQSLITNNRFPRLANDIIVNAINNASDFQQYLHLVRTLRDIPFDIEPDALIKRIALEHDRLGVLLDTAQSVVEGSFGSLLFDRVVRQLPLIHVARAATQGNRRRMAQLRPETVSQKEWWPPGDSDRAQLVSILAEYEEIDWNCVLNILTPSIGALTVSALLVALADGAEQIGTELFARAEPHIKESVAEWFVNRPAALKRLAISFGTVSTAQLMALTQAQLRQPPPFREQDGWVEIFTAAGDGATACNASLIIGYLLSLNMGGPSSIQLGQLVFEQLYLARENYRLSSSEIRYLELSLKFSGVSTYGTRAIVQSALNKWPVKASNCGALEFCKERTLVFTLASEVELRGGIPLLESALGSRQLNDRVKEHLSIYLSEREKMKKPSWPFRWW